VLFKRLQIKNLEILKQPWPITTDGGFCKEAPDRLFPLACLQLYDLDEHRRDGTRKKLGPPGRVHPATAPSDRLYSDRCTTKFWTPPGDADAADHAHFHRRDAEPWLPSASREPLAFARHVHHRRPHPSGVCERYPASSSSSPSSRRAGRPSCSSGSTGHYIPVGAPGPLGSLEPSAYWSATSTSRSRTIPIGPANRDFIGTNTLLGVTLPAR